MVRRQKLPVFRIKYHLRLMVNQLMATKLMSNTLMPNKE